jgi:hypothetical protein
LDEIAEVMFQEGECPCELILCLLVVLQNDFGDVDEAMFHDVIITLELIF